MAPMMILSTKISMAPVDNIALKEDDSDSDESVAEAVDKPIFFDKGIQPLDPTVANDWNFSTKKKIRIVRLLDAHDGNDFAMRRAPSILQYGSGPLKHYLVCGGQLVVIVLVGRISYISFPDNKPTVTLNVVPILSKDLRTANALLAHYSIPKDKPKNYAGIRTSTQLAREGLETYDAVGGVQPKAKIRKLNTSQAKKGNLVAVELTVKKWSGSGETTEHGSYDLRAILLLRKGTPTDEAGVDDATAGPITNAFSSSFYASLNSSA